MAEYIDKEKALADLKESADHHAQDSREWQLLLRDRNILREQATADVIERSKIDKAIEEIEKSFELTVGTYNGDTPERQLPSRKIERNEGRYQALEILKRNIGE